MFETFKVIKDDPRSSTGVFRALKRNTSHGSDGYCVYTFHNFGIAAEAEFTTVHEDDVRNEAFEVCAGDGSRHPREVMFGKRGDDDKGWINNIQRVG